ncbi:MAG: PEGA domain-containing protein [Bacteroidetes bacterium]|nr:PEGA domain-containing protein [Bacteroidota bacterium]
MKQFLWYLCLITAQLHGQEKQLTFLSVPESCIVSMNNVFAGTTPFRTEIPDSISSGPVEIRFSKAGYVPQTRIYPSLRDTISAQLSAAASLRITTTPESASVFIGDVLYGKSPLTIDTLTARPISVTIVKQRYFPYKIDLTLIEQQQILLSPILQNFSTNLSVSTNLPTAEIFLDGTLIGAGNVESVDVSIGGHYLTVRDPESGVNTERSFVVNSIGSKALRADMRFFSYTKLIYGIAIPGSAQLMDGSYLKGIAFLGTGVLSIVNYMKSRSQHSDKQYVYDDAQKKYSITTNEKVAAPARAKMIAAHNDLDQATKELNKWALINAVIWTLNGLDVFFFHSKDDTITELTGNGPFLSFQQSEPRSLLLNYSISF